MSQQALPLSGIRVIDYSHFLAGPYVGRCLAALGAEVIKIERPKTGDAGRQHAWFVGEDGEYSGYFLQLNMGKKGVCVNMKDPRGREFMEKLVDTADVFIENYRPGALSKMGLGYEDLARRNPGLVYCSISAYGHTGPEVREGLVWTLAEAEAALLADIGEHSAELASRLPWMARLDPARRRVLQNMAFNLGVGEPGGRKGLLGFRNTLGMIERGEYAAAADAMLKSLWARQVGQRAVRLSNTMRTGQ